MKKILTCLFVFMQIFNLNLNAKLQPIKYINNFASSAIDLYNATSNTTINSITVSYTDSNGPQNYTVSTNIPPNGHTYIPLGNLTFNVTVTLALSGPRTGSIQAWNSDYDNIGCQNYFYTSNPSLSFYLYGYNIVSIIDNQIC